MMLGERVKSESKSQSRISVLSHAICWECSNTRWLGVLAHTMARSDYVRVIVACETAHTRRIHQAPVHVEAEHVERQAVVLPPPNFSASLCL